MSRQEGLDFTAGALGREAPDGTGGGAGDAAPSPASAAAVFASDADAAKLETMAGQLMFQASPDCVKLMDIEGRLLRMNDNGISLMEISDFAELRGKAWDEMWPPHLHAVMGEAVRAAREGRHTRFTVERPTARGTMKWWDVIVSPIADSVGSVQFLMSVARDISGQKAVELSFKRSEQRFRAIANAIPQLAWMADKSGYIFWYNKRWFDYTGTTLSEMVGNGWRAVHHPDHVERVAEKFSGCIMRGENWEDTFPLRGVDGNYHWFLSRASPLRDENGNIELWCGTNTDITEQRNTSQRVRQLARIMELSHEAILIWEPKGHIVSWNRGCEELFGYSKSVAVGAPRAELLGVDQPEHLLDALSEQGEWNGEILARASDGAEIWLDSRLEVIRVDGQDVILETNRDITDRRRSDELRDLLLSELNHRVKNTLAIVQSMAKQTARGAPDMPGFLSRFNGRLQALSIAHNVLTNAHWTGAEVRDLITSELVSSIGDARNIELVGEPVFLPSQTALQLSMILHELAANAVQHGALSTPAGRLNISWQTDESNANALHITWREIGGPAVTAPSARGFGLNLIERSGRLPNLKTSLEFAADGVVCRIIAQAGQESADNGYFVPGTHSKAARAGQNAVRREQVKPVLRRILIVEGDPMHADRLEEILGSSGYLTLVVAASPESVASAITGRTFDAAIVEAPRAGDDTKILDDLAGRSIPVVLAHSPAGGAAPCALSTQKMLHKPFNSDDVLSVVGGLVDSRGAAEQI